MNILFATNKLAKECNDQTMLVRKHGARRAKLIRQRLDDLHAADTLEIMRSLPGRCHELRIDRKGQLALDLDHPYRLIFVPHHDPIPRKVDGGLDWKNVTSVLIIEVREDYHG